MWKFQDWSKVKGRSLSVEIINRKILEILLTSSNEKIQVFRRRIDYREILISLLTDTECVTQLHFPKTRIQKRIKKSRERLTEFEELEFFFLSPCYSLQNFM